MDKLQMPAQATALADLRGGPGEVQDSKATSEHTPGHNQEGCESVQSINTELTKTEDAHGERDRAGLENLLKPANDGTPSDSNDAVEPEANAVGPSTKIEQKCITVAMPPRRLFKRCGPHALEAVEPSIYYKRAFVQIDELLPEGKDEHGMAFTKLRIIISRGSCKLDENEKRVWLTDEQKPDLQLMRMSDFHIRSRDGAVIATNSELSEVLQGPPEAEGVDFVVHAGYIYPGMPGFRR